MFKQLFTTILLLWAAQLMAQDIPFIQRDQINRWINTESDTIFVINFWATWCAPCVAELPAFEKLNKEYAKDKVQVVLVNNDFKKQVNSKVVPFVKKKNLQSRVVFMDEPNPNNWINLVSTEWSGSIPATLIVSKRKNKVLFFEKPLEYHELEKLVLSVL